MLVEMDKKELPCKCDRIASVGGKCSDMFNATIGEKEMNGYVPKELGIGSGDYIQFKYCLDCGKIQGNFPLPLTEIEEG